MGHGQTLYGADIDKTALWIDEIFKKHDISAAHFVGVSLGAVLVQDFANHYKDKVLSLACFGGYDINDFDFKAQKKNSKAQAGMMLKALISIKWFAKANKKISAYTPRAQEEFYMLNLNFKKRSFLALSKLSALVNKFPKTERAYPLLIGCGEHDIPMEIDLVNEWAEKEHCEKVIFSGAGHCVNMDVPEEFNSVMDEFWKRTKE